MDITYIFIIYFLNMFHIFSLVCFLMYGVKSRSGHDRMTSFNSISHISGSKLAFWGNFIFVRYQVSTRKLKSTLKLSKNVVWIPKTLFFRKIALKKHVFCLQTVFFYSFNVLLSFLPEELYRTNMKLAQKASLGPETCGIWPKVWFLYFRFRFQI